ncbi:MAG: DUF4265 domain-containing protein [Candidatus Melainabacteria bacterium]|nr:DUF4265 domain-containing protein [Candidatus Melainabacteria bacterium]
MSKEDSEFVKIRFRLEVRDQWPPVDSEGLWAVPLGENRYRLDNTPWFVRGIACGDIVIAQADSDGILWFVERDKWGGHMTIRIIPRSDSQTPLTLADVIARLNGTGIGLECEGLQQYGIVAIDVLPVSESDGHTGLIKLKDCLSKGEADGLWYFEEGLVSEAWLQL